VKPLTGIAVVLLALGLGFVLLRVIEQRFAPHPELLRKLMHIGMGLVCAAFPWLFSEAWPVVVLALTSLALLMLVRFGAPGTGMLRGIVHGVERASWGELLFPPAVATVFLLANGDSLLYSVPILILALADAVAALIGLYYGQVRFATLDGEKSVEGSLAFFLVTFLCVHTALLLFTGVGRAESMMIGVVIGLVVMMSEAIAWRGIDNLVIPLLCFALLRAYMGMSASELSVRLSVLLLLGLFVLFWRRRSTFNACALIGAVLVGYSSWALGGSGWLAVTLAAFVIPTVATIRRHGAGRAEPVHTLHALLSIAGPGLIWLLLAGETGAPEAFLFGCATAYAAHVAMLGISRLGMGREAIRAGHLLAPVGQGLLIVVVAGLVAPGVGSHAAWLPVGAVAIVAAGVGFSRLQPQLHDCPTTPERWTRQGVIAGATSLFAWLAVGGAGGLA
jgi:phytol kinase